MSPTALKIVEILSRDLSAEVELTDESHKHAGHAGARGGGGHYFVVVRSRAFAGLAPLARQRLVYGALGSMMQNEIHALSMKCEVLP
jgi:BolA protein